MHPESFVLIRDDAVARYRCLTGEGACGAPLSFDDTAALLPRDFRRFYACRAGDQPFSWARFAEVVNDELIVPLEAIVGAATAALAAGGIPAAWRRDDEARRIVDRARAVADEVRLRLSVWRVDAAIAALVEAFDDLAGVIAPGPPAAAVRDAMRRLLPFLGCITPAVASRAWTILGLRGRPAEQLAEGSLVDEPAPRVPHPPVFPTGPIDPLIAASWIDER